MLRIAPIALAILSGASLYAQAPCFDTNYGTLLPLTDDSVSLPQALGFTFPGPAGPVTQIRVASNGFIWLDGTSTNSRCCFGNEFQFLSDPPSIAAGWMDLYPPGAVAPNGVYFNAVATPSPYAVITWLNVPEYFSNPTVTFQLTLFPSGDFIITHGGNQSLVSHDMLVGVTAGNNAAPGAIDVSQTGSAPVNTGASPNAYEVFTYFPTVNYDISGRSFQFVPNGLGGYVVLERTNCRQAGVSTHGRGCPNPMVVYEEFQFGTYDLANVSFSFFPSGGTYAVIPTGGTYLDPTRVGSTAVNLGLFDDSVSAAQTLPWPFLYSGGMTTQIEVASNGLVYLVPGVMQGNSNCCNGDATLFAQMASPAIAPFWQDLNPSAGGGVFVESDPSTGSFLVTWNAVPEFGASGSSNSVQLAMFASGQFEIRSLPGTATVNHTALVGYTQGNALTVPPGIDFSAAMPFVTSVGGAPLELGPAAGSTPRIGTTFTADITGIPSGALLGFMILNFTGFPNGVDLTPLGMAGCTQYVDLVGSSSTAFAVTPPSATFNLTIPNNTAFVGIDVHAQSAVIPTTYTVLGAIVSNGMLLSVGS